MKILVSACLLGENCKYNGGNNYSEELSIILENHTVIPVCPEVMGGLSTPRDPNEIVNGVVFTDKGVNRDKEFREGAEIGLKLALKEDADLAILQPRSPSCGVGIIYDGTFSKVKIPGNGVFAEKLLENGYKHLISFEKFGVLIRTGNNDNNDNNGINEDDVLMLFKKIDK